MGKTDPQPMSDAHCVDCGKQRGIKYFSAYFTIPLKERQFYNIAHLEICNECLARTHRPRRLRVLAGLVPAKHDLPEGVERREEDPTQGMSAKQKRVWRREHRTKLATGDTPVIAEIPVERPVASPSPAPDAYPNVLPVGATFIPKGFARGKHTDLIIRLDPTDPVIPADARCVQHSEIQGKEVAHPHWDFYRDRTSPSHLRPSCRELHRVPATKRAEMGRTWKAEHRAQLEEGRRMQQAEDAIDATVGVVEPIEQPVYPDEMSVAEAKNYNLPSFLPTNATFLSDLRVSIPEGFTAGTGTEGYLDLAARPLILAEAHRTGLFILTQLSEALASHHKLTDLQRKYDELLRLAHEAEQQLRRSKVIFDEQSAARDHWKQSYETEKKTHAELRGAVDEIREKARLDHDMLILTEQEVERLQSDLLTFEQMMKPFLGGRKVAEVLKEYRDELPVSNHS